MLLIKRGYWMFRHSILVFAASALMLSAPVQAATFMFDSNPFAGSDALITPGRQIVGGESFISFSTASDVFAFDTGVFGIGDNLAFANDVVGSLPHDANVIVLRTFDNDGNPGTAFSAGAAADLIADQITQSAPGFFVYFNSGLDLARLVYSTDLSYSDSDLKILARLTNFEGQAGRDAMSTFTAANFDFVATPVPEPAGIVLLASGIGFLVGRRLTQRRKRT